MALNLSFPDSIYTEANKPVAATLKADLAAIETEVNTKVKATGAEINTGTDDAKFATAKAIADAGISTIDHIVLTPAASKLVKLAVYRQDITTNAYKNNTVILTGWGFILGDNAANPLLKQITFGITFSVLPIIVGNYAGFKNNSDPADVGELIGVPDLNTWGFYNHATDGVRFAIHRTAGAWPNTYRVGYTWIAIGVLN